jgi:hypothetical protein
VKHHDLIVIGTGSGNSVIYYDGHAEFTGPRELSVTDEAGNRSQVTADRVPLKHVANREADAVKHNLVHPDKLARRPYWIHPALTEIVQNALLDVSAAA